jgi:hypothetical protein
MLAQSNSPAAHVGEDQSSRQFEERAAHWSNIAVQLLFAAKKLANDYLQEERDDVRACVSPEHHAAVRALFEAIKNADRSGLSDACAALVLLDAAASGSASRAPERDPRVPDMFEVGGAA